MPLIAVSDDLKDVLDNNKDLIKDMYITYKYLVDSAVRERLRKMGVKNVGHDEIIAHLEKLEQSKVRHLERSSIKRVKEHHKMRVAKAARDLSNLG